MPPGRAVDIRFLICSSFTPGTALSSTNSWLSFSSRVMEESVSVTHLISASVR